MIPNESRRLFLKKTSNLCLGAYLFLFLTAYSPKASAFDLDIKDQVIKFVSKYFGMDWVNDMKAGFDKINSMVKDLYGVVGGGAGGDDDANIKKIVGISKSNDAINTVNETVFNIEIASETQPSAVDACIVAGNKNRLNEVSSSSERSALRQMTAKANYTPEPLGQVKSLAQRGNKASKSLSRSDGPPAKITSDSLASSDEETLPPWLNMSVFLTNAGYYLKGKKSSQWSLEADEFSSYYLSDSGIIPDADFILKNFKELKDPRSLKLIEDITHIINARATIDQTLVKLKETRVRRADIFNIYANGEKEYVVKIAENHSRKQGSERLMSVIDTFNADVERFAQSPEFIKDFLKSDEPIDVSNPNEKKVIDELAVGHTPLLITAATMINAQQKWQLDIIEQQETIAKLQSLVGLFDQLIADSEYSTPSYVATFSDDPLFNFAKGRDNLEELV
jgi:hypothetical protein